MTAPIAARIAVAAQACLRHMQEADVIAASTREGEYVVLVARGEAAEALINITSELGRREERREPK